MDHYLGLNATMNSFKTFAESVGSSSQAAEVNKIGGIVSATKTASWGARLVRCSADAKETVANNNRVRNTLITALKDQFGAMSFDDLPKSVKAAMVGSHALSAKQDFKFDNEGNCTSGKPLTARRIAAVVQAVEEELNARVEKWLTTGNHLDRVVKAVLDKCPAIYQGAEELGNSKPWESDSVKINLRLYISARVTSGSGAINEFSHIRNCLGGPGSLYFNHCQDRFQIFSKALDDAIKAMRDAAVDEVKKGAALLPEGEAL